MTATEKRGELYGILENALDCSPERQEYMTYLFIFFFEQNKAYFFGNAEEMLPPEETMRLFNEQWAKGGIT
jgi:hypothetical protein